MQSHPCLSLEERSRLCRCLNYEKLSLEACKDLAKNPRIPPRIAIQALVSQHSSIPKDYHSDHHQDYSYINDHDHDTQLTKSSRELMVLFNNNGGHDHLHFDSTDNSSRSSSRHEHKEVDDGVVKLNLQKMQWRVVELEKICREMKGQMSKMVKDDRVMTSGSSHGRPLPRLCWPFGSFMIYFLLFFSTYFWFRCIRMCYECDFMYIINCLKYGLDQNSFPLGVVGFLP